MILTSSINVLKDSMLIFDDGLHNDELPDDGYYGCCILPQSTIDFFPNPFNPSTVISYDLAEDSEVSLTVYDILGNEIVCLVNKEQRAGPQEVEFNAGDLSSGIYFYKLIAGKYIAVRKMLLIR